MKKIILLGITIIFLAWIIYADTVTFVPPTPANNSNQTQGYVLINASIPIQNLQIVNYTWNGTDFLLYNYTTYMMMNFDNVAALGENTSYVKDISWRNSNLSCTNCPTLTTGKYGNAYNYDGVNDVFIGNSTDVNFPQLSISVWINGRVNKQYAMIVTKSNNADASTPFELCMGDVSGRVRFATYTGGWNDNWFNTTLQSNVWNHIVVTYNGSMKRAYINGVQDRSNFTLVGGGAITGPSKIRIGARKNTPEFFFNGTIDEVMILNKTLTFPEVQELYMSNLYKFNTTQWYLYMNQTQNGTTYLANGTYTYQVTGTDTTGLVNVSQQQTIVIGTGTPATTCTTGLTTGIFLCSDLCSLGTISIPNLYLSGVGTFKANITNYKNITISSSNCRAWVKQ